MKRLLLALVLVSVLTPAFAQANRSAEEVYGGAQTSANGQSKQDLQSAEVEFVDSPNAYWVNRGVNDTIYGSGGSVNAVRFERYQTRDEALLNKLRKPMPPVNPQWKWFGRRRFYRG